MFSLSFAISAKVTHSMTRWTVTVEAKELGQTFFEQRINQQLPIPFIGGRLLLLLLLLLACCGHPSPVRSGRSAPPSSLSSSSSTKSNFTLSARLTLATNFFACLHSGKGQISFLMKFNAILLQQVARIYSKDAYQQ